MSPAKVAEVEAPATAELRAAIERTWRGLHPRVVDVVVVQREGEWYIEIPGSEHVEHVTRAVNTLRFVAVNPHARALALAEAVTVAIAPAPPRPADPSPGLDLGATWQRIADADRKAQKTAEAFRNETHTDPTTDAGMVDGLRVKKLLDGQAENGTTLYAWTTLQIEPAAAGKRVAVAWEQFVAALAEADTILDEIGPLVAAEVAAVARAHEGGGSIADLPRLDRLHELASERQGRHEQVLAEVTAALRSLRITRDRNAGLRSLFETAARRRVLGAARAVVEGVATLQAERLAAKRAEALQIRTETPDPLATVIEAARLVDPGLVLPRLVWPDDPLAPPTIE
jgi:hypothetical protein